MQSVVDAAKKAGRFLSMGVCAALALALVCLSLAVLVQALALLVLDVLILPRRNPRLRRFNIFREHRTEEL